MASSTLATPRLCRACQMELLPYKDSEGEVVRPMVYCDERCHLIYLMFQSHFKQGRILAEIQYIQTYFPRKEGLPRIDFSL